MHISESGSIDINGLYDEGYSVSENLGLSEDNRAVYSVFYAKILLGEFDHSIGDLTAVKSKAFARAFAFASVNGAKPEQAIIDAQAVIFPEKEDDSQLLPGVMKG